MRAGAGFANKNGVPRGTPLGKENVSDATQRLENWKRLRAPGWPGFLRSFSRGSRVR